MNDDHQQLNIRYSVNEAFVICSLFALSITIHKLKKEKIIRILVSLKKKIHQFNRMHVM